MISPRPLAALFQILELDREWLAGAERPTRLAGVTPVRGTLVQNLNKTLLDEIATEYGTAVRLIFRVGDLGVFSLEPGYSADDLSALVAAAPTTPTFNFEVEVDKGALIADRIGETDAVLQRLYFQREALLRALRAGIVSIEHDLWPTPTLPLRLIVLDAEVAIEGEALSIVGPASGLALAAPMQPPVDRPDLERLSERRAEYIGWDSELSTALTPWHFVYSEATGDAAIRAQIDALVVLFSILFTCDRARTLPTQGGPPRIQAEFRGREYVAFVPVLQSQPFKDLSEAQRTAVLGLVGWCYQTQASGANDVDWLGDRLLFVQTRVAQALEGRPEAERERVFATAMPQIFEGVQWHWRAFIEGKVSEYLDRVQTLEAVVAEAVDRHAERTATLVKSLTDTILAAVAVLLASFIAAAFKDPFDATLFRIGLITYAGYVLIFPGALGLFAARGHAKQVDDSFDAQRAKFDEALFPDKVAAIVEHRPRKARDRYNRWWWCVAGIYLAVVLSAVLASWLVPGHVGSQ